MGCHQTARRREDSALAVAFYTAALQHKIQMVFVCAFYQALLVEVAIDLVVKRRLELLTPAVEAKVKENG